MELQINERFKKLIQPLSDEEFGLLRESILKEGLRDKLIVWNNVLVDGMNRYKICMEYNIPFEVTKMFFDDEDAAELWIMRNQLGRRNLSDVERGRIALKLKDRISAKAKVNQVRTSENRVCPILDKQDTKNELAKLAGISHGTLSKIEKVDSTAPEPIKQAMGKIISIDKAYEINRSLQSLPIDQQENSAEKIIQEEMSRQFKCIDQETKIYNKLSDIMSHVVKNQSYITEENIDIYLKLNKGSESMNDILDILDLSISELDRLKSMFSSKNCIRRVK